jgi:hypothetical protein
MAGLLNFCPLFKRLHIMGKEEIILVYYAYSSFGNSFILLRNYFIRIFFLFGANCFIIIAIRNRN